MRGNKDQRRNLGLLCTGRFNDGMPGKGGDGRGKGGRGNNGRGQTGGRGRGIRGRGNNYGGVAGSMPIQGQGMLQLFSHKIYSATNYSHIGSTINLMYRKICNIV